MPSTRDAVLYYHQSVQGIAAFFHTSAERGLPGEEAVKRLEKYGHNEFRKEKRKSLLQKFAGQFTSFMVLVLLAAALISGVVGWIEGEGFTDAAIILVIVILNAVIGTAQEAKAEKSLEALEKMAAPHCTVIRNGQAETLAVRELVPGDLVVLETGNQVPADLRLTKSVNLKIEEAALTGESLPEEKHTRSLEGEIPLGDRENMAFASSVVTYGRGEGLVVATGMETEVGKIAAMLQSVPDTRTPMQEKIDTLGKFLGIAAVSVCVLIFVAGFLQGRNVLDMFMIAVSLAAAAIPEGLPAVSTIVLAVGVHRLAKKNAIVRSLPSVEALGNIGVICSDKTGTLTQNKMTVVRFFIRGKSLPVPESLDAFQKSFLTTLILANDGKVSEQEGGLQTTGDPTETALLDIGLLHGLDKNLLEEQFPRSAEIPFDSDRKMMSTVNRDASGVFQVHVKGGLEEVLARCTKIAGDDGLHPLTEREKEEIRKANAEMAGSALRVLAAATKTLEALPEEISSKNLEQGLIFCGMLGMMDPPRVEVKDAVTTCRTAGIKPVMITGDHLITAVAIAESLGIKEKGDKAFVGSEVEKMSDRELESNVLDTSVYARVSPEHKVRIVRAFQKNKRIVAMTGDGVNDAPALKLANIGVAMGITGTDVSKEAADVVLADDNFATIVSAVEEGRRIYGNILKAIQFMLSTNVGEILVIFIAILAKWPTPLLPIQILWINLVTDSLPALALSVDPAEPGTMERKPVDAAEGIMTPPFLLRIGLQGIMIAALSLTAFLVGRQAGVDVAQTMTFAVLGLTQITHVFNVRSAHKSALRGLFSNRLLLGAVAIVLFLMLAVLEIPALHGIFHLAELNRTQWAWVAGLSLAPLPIVEFVKAAWRFRQSA